MNWKYILISPVLFLLTLIGGINVSADTGFVVQSNYATSSRTNSSFTQCLGTQSDLSLDTLGDVQLMLAYQPSGGGSSDAHMDILEFANKAGCETTGTVSRVWTYQETADLTLSPVIYTFTPTTSISLLSTKYYAIRVNHDTGGAGTNLRVYGASTSTTDYWPYGRCISSGSKDCDSRSPDPAGYGIRDMYFVAFGAGSDTRIIQPDPSWNEIVPPDATTTTALTWGGSGYINQSDGDEFKVKIVLKYMDGGLGAYGQTSVDENLGPGSFNIANLTDIPSLIGRWQMHYSIIRVLDFFPDYNVYSTSTVFYLGANNDNASSTGDVSLDDLKSRLDEVDCSINILSTSVFGDVFECGWKYFLTILKFGVDAFTELLSNFLHYVVTRAPWGYAYRVYYIFTNPDEDYTLPSISMENINGDTLTWSPWASFSSAIDTLSNATSNEATSTSFLDFGAYYLNIILGICFGMWVIHRIMIFSARGDFTFGRGRGGNSKMKEH